MNIELREGDLEPDNPDDDLDHTSGRRHLEVGLDPALPEVPGGRPPGETREMICIEPKTVSKYPGSDSRTVFMAMLMSIAITISRDSISTSYRSGLTVPPSIRAVKGGAEIRSSRATEGGRLRESSATRVNSFQWMESRRFG